jgi:VCBS repeat-containing protein
MATMSAVGDGPSVAPVVLLPGGNGSVHVADAQALFLGDYSRQGHDLVIEHNGASLLVEGYFDGAGSNLVGPNGAYLTPSVVHALAGPIAPGQYAQEGGATAATALSEIGKVVSIEGTATITHSDGVTVNLANGDPVYQGDVVSTGAGSKLGISFIDDSVFSMSADARMVLDELIFDPAKVADSSMVVNLVQGSFVFVTGQVAPSGNMKVETPVATMGIRGTTPKVSVSTELGVTEFSILPDPGSGKVGSYVLLDKATGAILGTVESVGDKWVITTLSDEAVKVAKSGLDLLEDEAAISDIRDAVSNALGKRAEYSGSNSFQQVAFNASASNSGQDGDQNSDGGGASGDGSGGNVDPTPDKDDPPIAGDDAFSTNEDLVLAGKNVISASGGGPDVDPDGFALSVTQVNGADLTFNAGGTASVVLPADAALQTVGANLLISKTGSITYDPTSAFNYLAVGQQRIESFTYTVRDKNGFTDTATVSITVDGRNDAPEIIDGPASTTLAESSEAGGVGGGFTGGPVTGSLAFTDVDISDAGHTYQVVSVTETPNDGAPPNPLGGAALLAMLNTAGSADDGETGTDGTIVWNFTGAEDDFDYLAAGESVTLVYTVQVTDPHGATDTQTVTVTIIGAADDGSNDAPTITLETGDTAVAGLTETNAGLTASGTLTVTEVDLTDEVDLSVVSVSAGGTGPAAGRPDDVDLMDMMSVPPTPILTDAISTVEEFTWTFDSNGEAFDYLAVGETLVLTYTVRATDDQNAYDDQTVTITITGSNDAPVISAITQSDLTEQADTLALTANIAVTFTDVDLNDIGHTATVTAVTVDGEDGGLALDDAALIALVTPGTATKVAGSDDGSVTLAFSAASTAFDYLADGEVLTLTYTVAIDDGDGGVTPQTFVVEITGSNDAPVVAAITQSDLTEQTDTLALTANIAVTFTDVDLNDIGHTATVTAVTVDGEDGGLALDDAALIALVTPGTATKVAGSDDGSVTLAFSAASTAFDYLADGEVLTLTYTVAIDDGDGGVTPQTFVVEITGSNDAPVVAAIAQSDLTEQTDTLALTANIAVTFTDVDLNDIGHTATVTAVTVDGEDGGLALDDAALIALVTPGTATKVAGSDDGSVTLAFSAASTAFDYLADGEVLTLTYTVEIDDGDGGVTPQTFVVEITGSNDAPVISAITQSDLTEQADTLALTANIAVTFTDVDLNDIGHTATVTAVTVDGEDGGLALDDAALIALVTPGTATKVAGSDDGSVTLAFSAASTAFDYLADGEVLTLTYTVAIDDGDGGVTPQTFVVEITGSNDAPVVAAIAQSDLTEQTDTLALTANIAVTFTDVDLNDIGHTATVTAVTVDGEDGGLALDDAALIALVTPGTATKVAGSDDGSVTLAFSAASTAFDYLADGEVLTLTYTVAIDDGDGGVTPQTFVVEITGSNDAPTIVPVVSTTTINFTVMLGLDGYGSIGASETLTGQILVDAQSGDAISLTLSHATEGSFTSTDVAIGALNDAFGGTTDVITVQASGLLGALGGIDPGTASLNLDLRGPNTVLASTEVPLDAAVWNELTNTTLQMPDPDQAEPRTATTGVGVINPFPDFVTGDEATGEVFEITDGQPGENTAAHSTTGTLDFADVDASDAHTVSFDPAVGNPTDLPSAIFTLTNPLTVNADGNIGWEFTVDDTDLDFLAEGETRAFTYAVTIDDGNGGTDAQDVVVTITGTNDAPTVTAGAGLNYSWNDGEQIVDATVTVADVDDTHLVGARVSIGTGYVQGEDVLAFVNTSEITGMFDPATGVLELTGVATIDAYETALRSVTYANLADAPVDGDRVISFIVNDGDADGLAATSTVTVVPFNDVFGDAFVNVLNGSAASDRIYGYADNDDLFGLAGNDQLFGGDGDDQLFGGDGDDRLFGGDGSDQLTGGAGADEFVFLANSLGDPLEADQILDFNVNEDFINLDDLLAPGFDPFAPIEISLVDNGSGSDLVVSGEIVASLDGISDTETINIIYDDAVSFAFSNALNA